MKKIFYNKRRRLPVWSQIYIVWLIFLLLGLTWIWKYEIIKNTGTLKNKYNYKENLDIINRSYLSSVKNTNFMKDHNENEIQIINGILKPLKWEVEKINISIHNTKCDIIKYTPSGKKTNLVYLFDNAQDSISRIVYTFVITLAKDNITSVGVTAINGSPVCNDYIIENNIFNNESEAYIIVYPSRQNISGIQTAFLHGHSSIGWNGIIPKSEERPGILQQLAHRTLPYFQRAFVKKESNRLNLIGWHFPDPVYKNELDNINFILPGILFVAKNFSAVKYYENNIWIGQDTAISNRGVVILALILVLLIWLPIANRVYQKESIRNLFQAIFSAMVSSFLILIMLGATKIFSYLIPENILGPFIVIILGLVLFILLGKIHKSTFNVQVNSLTEFLVLVIFGSALAFYNFSIFIFLLPVIFLANRKSEWGPGVFKFLFFILISPVFYLAVMLIKKFGYADSVSLLVFNKVFFSHIFQTIVVVLFAGSLASIARDPA